MADKEEKPFPDVKEYVRNYTFDKEHQDTYKKLMTAYSVKERRSDNRLHQKSTTKLLTDLESLADDINGIEHQDHLYKVLGKILHKYDSAKAEVFNKSVEDDKKKMSKPHFNELSYKKRIQELVANYLKENEMDINSLINEIKEGNIETVVKNLMEKEHKIYQRDMATHKMEEVLPPNKDKDFYFKLANFWASKRQEDLTETDLRQMSVNRDELLKYLAGDYEVNRRNTLKKLKPERKDGKVVQLVGGGEKIAA